MIDMEGPERKCIQHQRPRHFVFKGEIRLNKKYLQAEEHATAQVQEGGPIY
jgi:hypothetical protein